MAGAGYDIGASASTSSGAQGGRTGDINLSGGGSGGGLASLLPKTTPDKAWIVYAIVGVVVVISLALWFKSKHR